MIAIGFGAKTSILRRFDAGVRKRREIQCPELNIGAEKDFS